MIVVFYGTSHVARDPLVLSMRADHVDSKHFGPISGYSMFVMTVGAVLDLLVHGSIANIVGGDRPGFQVLAAKTTANTSRFCFARRLVALRESA